MIVQYEGASLVRQLADHYGAPVEFVRRYVEQNGFVDAPVENVGAWLRSLKELSRLYVDYALSTNSRAKATVDQCIALHGGVPLRHLDIGAGHGGLVHEFAKRGVTSIGVEIEPKLFHLASANADAAGAAVLNTSILDADLEELGKFDVITCMEVIEHVHDPEELGRRIGSLLTSGGTAFLRIPNGRCVRSVKAEGHFLQFGMSLLTREEAKAYKNTATGIDDHYGHMGEYYGKEFYVWLLRKAGLHPEMVPSKPLDEFLNEFPRDASEMLAAFIDWRTNKAVKLPFFQRQLMELTISRYTAEAFAAYSSALLGGSVDDFVANYCSSFWLVSARKS